LGASSSWGGAGEEEEDERGGLEAASFFSVSLSRSSKILRNLTSMVRRRGEGGKEGG